MPPLKNAKKELEDMFDKLEKFTTCTKKNCKKQQEAILKNKKLLDSITNKQKEYFNALINRQVKESSRLLEDLKKLRLELAYTRESMNSYICAHEKCEKELDDLLKLVIDDKNNKCKTTKEKVVCDKHKLLKKNIGILSGKNKITQKEYETAILNIMTNIN